MSNMKNAVQIVSDFLEASMKPDPVLAATFMSDDVKITFTGKRVMENASVITQFNAGRYTWVKKAIESYDCAEKEDRVVVYSNGTLYGEWPDGRSFSGNRYLDRFEVKDGKIIKMDVWNDSAEWILAPEINQA
ncbi:nuclear transport factor 2 family protein [Catenovulum sp. 2E275]|uniref:nuclear transport factor 2 family protein n=1 Tax=Catenovulum sp. 2E275 TaxID=2980497 RepID=UPI0021CFAF97|nr:nuclear transport factor 2 family protein [Catenovulum sp. 2E275]MCU4677406.1 nuclear transport factor 2 family protein [Catenovulum sp. 2E275]